MEDLGHCNLNCLLNISNHYAILPYKCILNKTGLSIDTREVKIYIYITRLTFAIIFNVIEQDDLVLT